MPTLRLSLLVGIAHFIDRCSIMVLIRNAHPTILVGSWWALPMSLIAVQSWS
ncbi:MAG: hypothetical protein F6K49_44225 [Moorea sp. SIO3I6]|nr:hypothetical protein [Moorena sp. SIO3I6]